MSSPSSIVIAKLSAIGDVVHGIPVAVALKAAYPAARIGWAVEGRSGDVLAGHPAIDHLFRLPRGWSRSPAAIVRLRRELRAFRPDVAIDLQGLLKSALASRLSGAPLRIAHAPPESRERSWLLATHRVPATATHVVDRHCELLVALGLPIPVPRFEMPRWPVSRARVVRWFAENAWNDRPALINPGAGWRSKLWPEERFAAVARRLAADHHVPSVVVWGGSGERAAAERIVAASDGAASLAPPTTLQDLGELCRAARLMISSDTGPLHLAAAVGTPCVGLFGPVPAARNGPYGRGHAVVEPAPHLRPAWEDRKTDTVSMAGIGVEAVMAVIDTLLARSAAA